MATLFACSQHSNTDNTAASAVDSLRRQVAELKEKYKPGLGEIMSGIQMHHAKLWFAGINNNWKLAVYETGEIKEMLEWAKEIETDRPEVKDIPMIYPALDSISAAVEQQNSKLFKSSFLLLTNTCNNCHTAHHFEFNTITIPATPPVTNQAF